MMITKGGMTFSEILEQTEQWQNAVKIYNLERKTLVWMRKAKFNQVIFIGAGASYYAGGYASELFRSMGRIHAGVARSSDIVCSETLPFHPKLRTLVIALSRSGKTDETIWAVKHLKKVKPDIRVISLICQEDTPLAEVSDKTILLQNSYDDGMMPIKSYSTSVFLLSLMAAALGGKGEFLKELSKIPKEIDLKKYHEIISRVRGMQNFRQMIFLGTGAYQWLAAYGAILTKEMSLTSSQHYESFEFRHNHFVSAHNETLATCILSNRMKDQEITSMREAAKMKSQIFLLADDIDEMVEAGVENNIKFQSNLSPFSLSFHIIPCLQFIAFQHTIAKGKNPDKPKKIIDLVTYKDKPDFIE